MLKKPWHKVNKDKNEQNDLDGIKNAFTHVFSMDKQDVWPGCIERESYVDEDLTEQTVVLPVLLVMLDHNLDAFMREDLDIFVYIVMLKKRKYEF